MQSCVTISLLPSVAGGPWIFRDGLAESIAKTAATGFDAVELFFDDPQSIDARQLGALLHANRLKLAAVGTGAGKVLHGWTLTDSDPGIRNKAREYILRVIAFGAQFGAPAIIGSMQGWVTQGVQRRHCLDWLAEGLAEMVRASLDQGVGMIFEPLNRYETNIFNRIGDVALFLASRQLRGVRVLADLFHMNIEEESLDQAILQVGSSIGHIHFADSNRRPVGRGHIHMAPVAEAIKRIGYQGYLSAEALAYPDADGAAAQTMAAFRKWFP